ncbi:MAG: acetoacetate decarboxylase family protein [Microthrixaceae bacterium]
MTNQAQPSRHWGEIDGVSIDFPMVVQEMNSATLTWSVPLDAAAAVLPGDAFEPADMGGSAMLILALVDYLQNPWGDYLEVNFGLLVQPKGRPEEVGAFQWRMPVDQEMTCHAGNQVMGLPKTVEEISFDYSDDRVEVALDMDGEKTLRVSIPRPASADTPTSHESITYSYIDGVPTVVPLTIDMGTGVIDPAEVRIELGDSPAAKELAAMGLPRAPDMAMWGEGLSGTFDWPEPLT